VSEQIKIGPIVYELVDVAGLHDQEDRCKLDGHIRYGPCIIELEKNLSPQARCQVLWHEVLHAILAHAGYQKHDDCLLDALAYGIMAVLQDNPWLVET
jgi:hypothetical protein